MISIALPSTTNSSIPINFTVQQHHQDISSENFRAFSNSLQLFTILVASMLIPILVSCLVLVLWSAMVASKHLLLRRTLAKQGLNGPPPKFLVGNMHQVSQMRERATSKDMRVGDHDLLSRICPHFSYWSAVYGRRFLFWWGMEPRIAVVEPGLIKEILCTKAEHFGKSLLLKKGGVLLLGNGMVYANGENWAHRRRIVGPAFHVDMLKRMVPEMVESTSHMLSQWSQIIDACPDAANGAEIDINYYLSMATADVIARTAFSTRGGGHDKGKTVFELLTRLQKLFAQSNRYLWLPCSRMLPTAVNRKASKIKRSIEEALRDLVRERRAGRQKHGYGSDFLGLMLSESDRERWDSTENGENKRKRRQHFQTSELVEECKTIFFTGHETTSALLTWTLMLLALHPEWQQRGRTEVLQVLSHYRTPDAEDLAKLKTLGMILNETLRLYPPAPALVRESLVDLGVEDMFVPRGTTFWIPIVAIHQSKDVWGDDALDFKPERFAAGVAAACQQQSWKFMPFSLGPRACLGQNFAMMEAKVVLAMILQRFQFRISPSYRHAPVTAITLKPKHGMQLIVSRVADEMTNS